MLTCARCLFLTALLFRIMDKQLQIKPFKFLVFSFLVFLSNPLSAQEWYDMTLEEKVHVATVEKVAEKYFEEVEGW